jgi:hypothetical protein
MSKRAVIAVLWFLAVWVGYEVLWSVTGVPRGVGPVIAAAVAGAVTVSLPSLSGVHAVPRPAGPTIGRQVAGEH